MYTNILIMKFFIFSNYHVKNAIEQNFVRSGHLRAKYRYAQRNSKLIRNLIMKLVHFLFSIRYFRKSYMYKCVLTY